MFRKFAIALALGTSSLVVASPSVAQSAEAAPADPARLKLAETMAGKIIPPGSYEKMMKEMSGQIADTIIAQTMGMDAATFAKASGEHTSAVDGKSIGELAAEMDPHFKERMDITMKVMFHEMGTLMNAMEPSARSALAKVYARKYSAEQLTDLNNFFATPTGSAFGADFMSTFTDKEMMTAMMGEMPKMLEAMPAIMKKVEEATAHLPPPPHPEGDSEEAAAAGAAAAAEGAAAAAEDAARRASWSKADLKAVEKLEAEQTRLLNRYIVAETAFNDNSDKLQAAIDTAKRNAGQPTDDEIMAAEDIPADAVPPPAIPN